jgi:hypothetical protein
MAKFRVGDRVKFRRDELDQAQYPGIGIVVNTAMPPLDNLISVRFGEITGDWYDRRFELIDDNGLDRVPNDFKDL